MKKEDPCEKLTVSSLPDRFFPLGDIGNGKHGVLHCKLNKRKNKYQTQSIIDADSFERFNTNEENSFDVISYNSHLESELKQRGKV